MALSRSARGLADRAAALVGWTIAWRAASAVSTLALGAVLVRQLPRAEYGRYTLVLSLLVYLALLATFGQDQALLRYLPELITRGDRSAVHDLLKKCVITVLSAWALTTLLVWALQPVIDNALHTRIGSLLALGTTLLLATIAAGILSFALVAVYDMRTQAIATPIAGAITLGLAFLFLRSGGGLGSVLLAGAVGQSSLACCYSVVLLRQVSRAGPSGERISWRRLLRYASGWLPSLLIASAVGLQFESLFLARFQGTVAVAYYDTGYAIPQRLVALLPSLLTGAWVVGTLEQFRGDAQRLRAAVVAFYKGIFLIAAPLAIAGAALLPAMIRWIYTDRYAAAAAIAPILLLFFVGALLTSPWGLVVRVRELAWINAGVSIAQVGFAALADWWLIQNFGLLGAVAAVGLTTVLTLALSLLAWGFFDRASLAIPWRYGVRTMLAAAPYVGLYALILLGAQLPLLLIAAAVLSVVWLWMVRRLRLLARDEVPLLHESRQAPVRWVLGRLAPRY